MSALTLKVHTPSGLLVDQSVLAVRAEDLSGWFGILPGRESVVAVLPPGLLLYRDAQGEGFVALAGALLRHEGGECHVTAREAVSARSLELVAPMLQAQLTRRGERAEMQRDAVHRLAREALRRMVTELRA
ncbi:MAG: hypothetical protein R3A48_03690 [Polyangiales bacterium]